MIKSPANLAVHRSTPVDALTPLKPTAQVTDLRYGVRIGGIGLLIGTQVQSEAILPLPVSRIPNTPAWFSGLMNLRGRLVPLFDVGLLIGLDEGKTTPKATEESPLFLVIDQGEHAAALKIEHFPQGLSGLEPLTEPLTAPSPLDECIGDAYVADRVTWFEFDHERLFELFSSRLAKEAGASGW